MLAALAAPTVNVTFPEKGAYIYWFEFKNALGKPEVTAPRRAAGESAAIDLAPAATAGNLAPGSLKIYDPKSGNAAEKSLENLAGKKELKLKPADFDLVRTVRIVLKPAEGKPDERIESALVTLKDANSEEFRAVVDPSSEGVAEFHDIAGGQESVTVAYEGGSITHDVEVPLERETPVFTHTVAISGDVRTVKVAAPAAGPSEGKAAPAKPKPEPPESGGWLPPLMGLVLLGIAAFIAYVVLRSKGVTLQSALKKLGVQFPEAEEAGSVPAPQPQVDPSVCQFCGQRKDPATGACACSIEAVPAGHHGATAAGQPRLIGTQGPYAGRIFDLPATDATIGRDAANAVPLSDDTTVSRRHARITCDNGLMTITDEGSSNGTFVNGTRISGAHTLQPGDELQIGNTKFRFDA